MIQYLKKFLISKLKMRHLILIPVVICAFLFGLYQVSGHFKFFVCALVVPESREGFCPRKIGNDNDVALEQARRIKRTEQMKVKEE